MIQDTFQRTFIYDRLPSTADWKNFKILDFWVYIDPDGEKEAKFFILLDISNQKSVWIELGGSENGNLQSIIRDGSLNHVFDSSDNANILEGE